MESDAIVPGGDVVWKAWLVLTKPGGGLALFGHQETGRAYRDEPVFVSVYPINVGKFLPEGGDVSLRVIVGDSVSGEILRASYGGPGGAFHYGFRLVNTSAGESCAVSIGPDTMEVQAGSEMSVSGHFAASEGQSVDFVVPPGWHAEPAPGSALVHLTDGHDYQWAPDVAPIINLVRDSIPITVKVRVFDASVGSWVISSWGGYVKVGELTTVHDGHTEVEMTAAVPVGVTVSLDGVPANVHVIASPFDRTVSASNTSFYWDLYIPPSGADGDGEGSKEIVEAIEHFEKEFKDETIKNAIISSGSSVSNTVHSEGAATRDALNAGFDALLQKNSNIDVNVALDDSRIVDAINSHKAASYDIWESLKDFLMYGAPGLAAYQAEYTFGNVAGEFAEAAQEAAGRGGGAGQEIVNQFGNTGGVQLDFVEDNDYVLLGVIGGEEIRVYKDPFHEDGPFGGALASVAGFIRRLIAWGLVVVFFVWVMGEINKAIADGFKVSPLGDRVSDMVSNFSFLGFSMGPFAKFGMKVFLTTIVVGLMLTLPAGILAATTAGLPWDDLRTIYATGIPPVEETPDSGVSLVRALSMANRVLPLLLLLSIPLL
jgi:hypothetical protein